MPRSDRLTMEDAGAADASTSYAPPFGVIDSPWRENPGSLCGSAQPETLHLWADKTGLATLSVEQDGFEVRRNTGHGWTWVTGYAGVHQAPVLAGYPEGNRLILGGSGFVVDLELDGTLGEGVAISSGYPRDVVGLDAKRALAAVIQGSRGSGLSFLSERRDDGWWDIPLRGSMSSGVFIAANADTVFLGARELAMLEGQYVVPVEGWDERSRRRIDELELMDDGTLYVFADDELGSVVDIYDGITWKEVGFTGATVERAWTDGRIAYFVTAHSFGRVSELGVEILLDTADTPEFIFRGLTGIAGEGVFFSATDTSTAGEDCSPFLVFFFDGTNYRRL